MQTLTKVRLPELTQLPLVGDELLLGTHAYGLLGTPLDFEALTPVEALTPLDF